MTLPKPISRSAAITSSTRPMVVAKDFMVVPRARAPSGVRLRGQAIAEPSRSRLSARAKSLLIRAIRHVRPSGAGLDESRRRRCGPRDEGRGEARPSNEWRVLAGFWLEKAGAGRVPFRISAVHRRDDVRRGRLRALSRSVRRARSVPTIPTPLAARSFPAADIEGTGGTPPDSPPHRRSKQPTKDRRHPNATDGPSNRLGACSG
jgi:hypothetical protein